MRKADHNNIIGSRFDNYKIPREILCSIKDLRRSRTKIIVTWDSGDARIHFLQYQQQVTDQVNVKNFKKKYMHVKVAAQNVYFELIRARIRDVY